MLGTNATSRSTRRIRSERSTENASEAGINAIPMTTKSNTLHGSRKKRIPCAASRSISSTTKIVSAIRSTAWSSPPNCATN
jgi:hypothetical protein